MFDRPRRGQLWFVRLDPTEGHEQSKTRPCLVISNNKFNCGAANMLVVTPITSKNKRVPLHIAVDSANSDLKIASFVMPEHIRAVSITQFGKFIGTVNSGVLSDVEEKIKLLLDFE